MELIKCSGISPLEFMTWKKKAIITQGKQLWLKISFMSDVPMGPKVLIVQIIEETLV